ncbi:unnamed protein product [Strongylus vulgaris]|uniref:Uncharacterized protein n=1 Tax=Strongylus vulgaris TaxID=40348 RepID=A0A3P7IYT1_STRVU|nr:unnamed protein product [Strongylus vulgaris]
MVGTKIAVGKEDAMTGESETEGKIEEMTKEEEVGVGAKAETDIWIESGSELR